MLLINKVIFYLRVSPETTKKKENSSYDVDGWYQKQNLDKYTLFLFLTSIFHLFSSFFFIDMSACVWVCVPLSLSLIRFLFLFEHVYSICRSYFFIINITGTQLISSRTERKHKLQREDKVGVFIACSSNIRHFLAILFSLSVSLAPFSLTSTDESRRHEKKSSNAH